MAGVVAGFRSSQEAVSAARWVGSDLPGTVWSQLDEAVGEPGAGAAGG